MTLAYYNEFDPFCADWLLELIADGLIAPGIVDRRSIVDVLPSDLKGFNQCHFFAGIAVWSLSLRLAGFPDDRPIWTGSAPCQPFSAAGKAAGFDDERHLWPAWFHLIECAKPANVPLIGEQVASKDGRAWYDLVSSDMEGLGHACGALDTCAAGLGAPFIGQRLYWLAAPAGSRCEGVSGRGTAQDERITERGENGGMGATDHQYERSARSQPSRPNNSVRPSETDWMAATDSGECNGRSIITGRDDSRGLDAEWSESDGRLAACGENDRMAASNSGECEQQQSERRPDGLLGASYGSTGSIDGPSDSSAGLHRMAASESGRDGRQRDTGQLSIGIGTGEADSTPDTYGNSGIPLHPVDYWRDAEWLLCRDPNGPRFRPVESSHVIMVDVGTVGGYVVASSGESCETASQEPKEIDDANVRSLRQDAGNENISAIGTHGEHQHLCETPLLQPAMHGGLAVRSNQSDEASEQSQTIGADAEAELRKVRKNEQSDARASSGRESVEQQSIECPDVVRFMSHALTLAELRRDNATAEALLALRQAILSKGAVLHPSDSLEAVWRSLSDADQKRIRMDHSFERWATVTHFPLTEKNTYVNRLNEIRGAGNALNVAQASTFIECVMEYLA